MISVVSSMAMVSKEVGDEDNGVGRRFVMGEVNSSRGCARDLVKTPRMAIMTVKTGACADSAFSCCKGQ